MDKSTKILSSVAVVLDFIKSQIKSNLTEANNRNMISIEKNQLEKVVSLVDASIDQVFSKSSIEIEAVVKNTR